MLNQSFYVIVDFMLDLKKQTLLVISPHPDDEVLGCGGLIKKIKDEGGKVYVLFLTVGDTKDYRKEGKSTENERMREVEAVAKFLKYDDYHFAFPGNQYHLRLDQLPQLEIMEKIERGTPVSLNVIKPTIVTVPGLPDYNQDHRSGTYALFGAARPAPDDTKPLQRIILGYESVPIADWWSSPGAFNFFVPLTRDEVETKIEALKLYMSQIRSGSHPRSIESLRYLAYHRGRSAGAFAAEAFYSYRIII